MNEGDLEGASQLQRKLDQLERRDRQMERMERMAEQMAKCQASMESGDSKSASAELEKLASELEEMQAEMDELESLDELMDEIASAKDGMRDGDGESGMSDQFGGMSDQFSEMPGNGLGAGRGFGDRPEEETETGEYLDRQRGKVRPGEAVRIGDAVGPNKAGLSQEAIKDQILNSLSEDPDAGIDQKLPRSQRDHVNEYFKRVRTGE